MSEAVGPGKALRIYTYLVIYIVLSGLVIFFNKWIISDEGSNFPYPISLTMLHMAFSSVLCFLVVRVFRLIEPGQKITLDMYFSSVVPVALMFSLTLWLGNTAYIFISVAFSQMLKAMMPVAVFLVGVCFGIDEMKLSTFLNMSIISGGVLIASYGEIHFDLLGVLYQGGSVISEAMRLVLTQILLQRKGIKMDPISILLYMSPACLVLLAVPWTFIEARPLLRAGLPTTLSPTALLFNSLATFFLNISVFLVIQNTSALTIRVASVIKDWLVVFVSALLFDRSQLTPLSIGGYAFAMVGVYLYNRERLREVAANADLESRQRAKDSSPSAEELLSRPQPMVATSVVASTEDVPPSPPKRKDAQTGRGDWIQPWWAQAGFLVDAEGPKRALQPSRLSLESGLPSPAEESTAGAKTSRKLSLGPEGPASVVPGVRELAPNLRTISTG